MNEKLTYERLHEVLYYEPVIGVFTWVKTLCSSAISGEIAGSKSSYGYTVIRVDRKIYKAHRLAWLYTYGFFPEHDIDHINRVRDDNRLINLREVSRSCNSKNCNLSKNNTSGITGVSWIKQNNKWMAQMQIGRKMQYMGAYEDFDEAVCHRLAAEQCLGWGGCNSTSSAYLYVKNMLGRG